MSYESFLAARTHEGVGAGIPHGKLASSLFPFQRDVLEWARR
jgi:hypothetical protein